MDNKFVLFHADFDEGDSSVTPIKDEEALYRYFFGETEVIEELLLDGCYIGEWGNYHIIKLEEYK